MGFGDLFKAKENEALRERIIDRDKQIESMREKISNLESLLTPEMQDSILLQQRIEAQKAQIGELRAAAQKEENLHQKKIKEQQEVLAKLTADAKEARIHLIETKEDALMQSFGLYTPKFSFANATGYKDALAKIRKDQKDLIRNGGAATGNSNWTVNGSVSKGNKMVKDMQKLLIRAFNTECDDVIDHVRFNNVESSEKRINSSFSAISNLGTICSISLTNRFRDLKLSELHLAYEYQIEKQKEKDRLKELRAEERERVKLEKEIEAERKKLEKESQHYNNAVKQIESQIANADPSELPALQEKLAELEGKLTDVKKAIEQVDYRAANQKAGYVYIISNIGAFGEGVYKIGMTRRLEPMDRIDELGDASVPFDFDVHALIFSEDAPALEAALHRAFEDRKLNMVNTRREFFRVSLDEIKDVVKNNYDKTVEFLDVPPAEQYRESELIRENQNR